MNNFSKIINPITNKQISIFSKEGKELLKSYVMLYNNNYQNQIGGDNGCAIN